MIILLSLFLFFKVLAYYSFVFLSWANQKLFLIWSTLRKIHGPIQGLKWLFLVPNPYTGFFGRPAAHFIFLDINLSVISSRSRQSYFHNWITFIYGGSILLVIPSFGLFPGYPDPYSTPHVIRRLLMRSLLVHVTQIWVIGFFHYPVWSVYPIYRNPHSSGYRYHRIHFVPPPLSYSRNQHQSNYYMYSDARFNP